jgi:hypothetical protein
MERTRGCGRPRAQRWPAPGRHLSAPRSAQCTNGRAANVAVSRQQAPRPGLRAGRSRHCHNPHQPVSTGQASTGSAQTATLGLARICQKLRHARPHTALWRLSPQQPWSCDVVVQCRAPHWCAWRPRSLHTAEAMCRFNSICVLTCTNRLRRLDTHRGVSGRLVNGKQMLKLRYFAHRRRQPVRLYGQACAYRSFDLISR